MKNHHVTGSLFVTLLAVSLVSFFFLFGTEEKWKLFFILFFCLSDVITYSSESTQHVVAPSVRYFLFLWPLFRVHTHRPEYYYMAVMTSSAFMANNSPDHNHKNQISRREFFFPPSENFIGGYIIYCPTTR
jgi:hypothetical protein